MLITIEVLIIIVINTFIYFTKGMLDSDEDDDDDEEYAEYVDAVLVAAATDAADAARRMATALQMQEFDQCCI